jgi:hypothetical protein
MDTNTNVDMDRDTPRGMQTDMDMHIDMVTFLDSLKKFQLPMAKPPLTLISLIPNEDSRQFVLSIIT